MNAYEVERRIVYGRTSYCVLSGNVTVARCDDRQAAHLIAGLLNTHTEAAIAAVINGGSK